ncbi:sensor histidine kinase [Chitinophaga barathri]|nr:HAMP domain-containing sensor histidine kinase [Chitinophaga barathri]
MPAFSPYPFTSIFTRIANIGVRTGMPFIEARRTRLLNLLALPWLPLMLIFCILNAFQDRHLLSLLNGLNVAGGLTVLWLHHRQRYLSARLLLIVYSIVLYTITALLYRNGAEYFLLNILIVTILVYDNTWLIATLSLITISAFLIIHFTGAEAPGQFTVPVPRIVFNVSCALLFPILALTYFKQVHADYQQEMEAKRQALAALNRDKEKLFSVIAHDIRGPLATLELLLDMFRKGEYNESSMLEASEELYKKVHHLGGSIDNMLRWSMGQMRGIRTAPEHFPPAPLADEVLQMFVPGIDGKSLQVTQDIPGEIYLFADREQVAVILRNLVSNAIKFSHPGGRIYLGASQSPSTVTLTVRDEGTGIAADKMSGLFSFQTIPSYGTGGERGSGLGLLLCLEFTNLNNGQLLVKSTPGEGTVFTVILPAGSAGAPANSDEADDEDF